MATFPVLLTLNIVILVLFTVNLTIWISLMVVLSPFDDPVMLLSITDATNFTFYTDVNLPPWCLALWGVVYAYQLLWIVYSFRLAFKFRQVGPPVLLTPAFLGIFVLIFVLQISLLIVGIFIRELAFVILLLNTAALFVNFGSSHIALFNNRLALAKQNRRTDDTLIRALVHNGVGLYASWTAVLLFINLPVLTSYRSDPLIEQRMASSTSLGLVAVFSLIYVITDLKVFDLLSRYTVTPYLVYLWFLAGVIINNAGFSGWNVIVEGAMFGAGTVALMLKVVVTVIRVQEYPIFPEVIRD